MAGNTTQTITTRFKTEGASKVVKDTEQIGRAQTRLGQASASSGRQFAAQASGLGGLVAAYAGAAATVFALQAAFDALARAARAETIVQGTKTLALEIGQSGPKILAQVQKITQGQIELSEAAQNVNIALSSGFNADQIERLTAVSLGASRALGRNLTDSLQRVVRGAAKLEPELLDELGIFVRIDPAVEAYAAKLNIAASQLTQFERRQAFVNAIIEEGEVKFGNIDTVSASTQKSLEQLQASIQELAISFGQLVGDVLTPLVDFFKNDTGNALVLFGGILTLVFGKAAEIIGSFAGASTRSAATFTDSLAAKTASSKAATAAIIADQERLKKSITEGGRVVLGGEASFQRGVSRDTASAAAAARRRFLAGETLTPQQRSADIKVLTKAQDELAASGRRGSRAFSDATAIITSYTTAAKGASLGTRVLTLATAGLTTAVNLLGTAFSFALKFLNFFAIAASAVQLLGSFFGFDIIGAIADFFKDAIDKSEDLRNGIVGLGTAVGEGRQSLVSFAQGISATSEQLENLNDTVIDVGKRINENVVDEVERATVGVRSKIFQLEEAIKNIERTDLATALQLEDEDLIDRLNAEIAAKKEQIGILKEEQLAIAATAREQSQLNKISEIRADLINKISKASGESKTQLQIELQVLENYRKNLEKIGFGLELFIGQLSASTGIASGDIVDTLAKSDKFFSNTATSVNLLGLEIKKNAQDGTVDFNTLTDSQQEFATSANIALQTLKTANEAYDRGATSAEKLSQQVSGISSQLITLRNTGEGSSEKIKELNEELDRLTERRDTIRTLENLTKGIRSAFGGDIKALDTAVFKGLVDSSGILARNTQEISNNQFALLKNTFETTLEFKKQKDELEAINSDLEKGLVVRGRQGKIISEQQKINQEIVDNAALNDLVVKATAGRIIDILQTSEKIIASEKIRELQLQNQLDVLREQTELLRLQNQLAQDQATQKAQIESLERSVNIDEKRFDLAKQITKANEDQFSAQQKLNDLKNQELQTQRDIADIQFQALLAQNETARTIATQNLSAKVDRQLEDPRTTQREQFDLRKSLIELERLQAQEIYKEQSELAERTYINELAAISARKTLLGQELDSLETRKMSLFSIALTERDLLKQRQAIETKKIENEQDTLKKKFDIDLKTAAAALDDVDRREALFEAQNNANAAIIAGFESFISGVNALNGGAFVAAVKEYLAFNQQDTSSINDAQALGQQFIQQAQTSAKKAGALLDSNAALQSEIFDAERENAAVKLLQIGKLYKIENDALNKKLEDTKILQKIESDALVQSQVARLREIEAQTKQVQQQLTNEDLLGQKAYEQLQAKLAGLEQEKLATENALDVRLKALNDEFDVFRKLDMQIAGIVQSNFTDFFMDMNTALIEGSLSFKTIADSFRDMVGSMLREIQAAVFRQTIVDPIVGSITKGITLFGNAAGGKVQHKAGGGSILRDRVATMLEPGEFVIRKEAAKKIGMSKLQDMNAGTSDDPVAAIMALLGSRFIKKAAGGASQTGYTQESLAQYGLGSRGMAIPIPGLSTLAMLMGIDLPRIGAKNAPRPSTQKEAAELAKTIDALEKVYGVRATRMKGFEIGDIDPVTGGIFGRQGAALTNIGNAVFGARTRQGTASFNSFQSGINAVRTGFSLGMFRSSPLSVAEYNAASPLARQRFNPQAYAAFGGQRAISVNQALALNTYGGYKNQGGGYTIPSGTFSGTIRDVSVAGGDRPDFSGAVQRSGQTIGQRAASDFTSSRVSDFSSRGFSGRGFAAGGSVMARDRVPALLEPGEFVIRRPAAKAIGGPALNQMNATGVAPNIAVNVNNQGVPKDVAVSAPRMNGDKVILDIITRDMRNNGAIRKSLRGNR